MLMQSERMSPRFNYQAATGPPSLHQLPAGAHTPPTDSVWLVYCAEPRGDAFLSSLLSNDHTESFLRTRRCCCVLLCGLLIQRGRVSSATSAHTVPATPTRTVNQTSGCQHAQTGWRLISTLREREGHTLASDLSFTFCFCEDSTVRFTTKSISNPLIPATGYFATPSCGQRFCWQRSDGRLSSSPVCLNYFNQTGNSITFKMKQKKKRRQHTYNILQNMKINISVTQYVLWQCKHS